MKSVKLRDCAVCGGPVMSKQYQKDSVRTCQPVCARTLAAREHPDLGPASGSGDFGASATWLRENRTRHAGKWVALKGGELVAADVSRRAVQSRIADRSDLRDLLVVRIDGQRR